MANNNSNRNDAIHLNPDNIIFSMFTKEEIKKLCVTKIRTPIVFDSVGHPLAEGLYDNTLGPVSDKKGELCGTCFKNSLTCPGHFGYIEIPLPVVNPLFHKIIYTLLRITCLRCYLVQLPLHMKRSISIQIKLLNCGLVTEAIEIDQRISELIAQYGSFENIPEEAVLPITTYEDIANETSAAQNGKITINKNTETLRNQFLNDLIRQIKQRKICLHCKKPLDKVQTLKNRIILSTRNKMNVSQISDANNSILSQSIRAQESKFVTPQESRQHLRSIWEHDRDLILELVPVLSGIKSEFPTDVFYFEVIPVTPSNLRPINMVNGRMVEHSQTHLYKNILQTSMVLRAVIQVVQNRGDIKILSTDAQVVYNLSRGTSPIEKLNNVWEDLQGNVNDLIDKDEKSKSSGEQGLKQIIEKKAGIIRMHMMGKRVNFAARSVITPDPNLNIDEIGIPEAFAIHLTYPVPVTSWNVEQLRKMILNGPLVHPGAVTVEFENGNILRINPHNAGHRESILKRLLTPGDKEHGFRGVKIVNRHLCNGDILLLNRQPTLHKPSIMAHTARILKGEKTLRLHYANCKAYNADFDGDEMNAHFPQTELARSEGYLLANVSNQYLVPKDGTPLSGLIQDHMISGVRLSVRGQFFTKDDYQQLVYQALSHKTGVIRTLPPSIIKPYKLWSGKQVLSTVIINIIPESRELINLTATSKISSKAWITAEPREWKAGGTPLKNDNDMSEAEVIIRNGELLVGVLDKTHYGATPYGLVHCIYELYGGTYAIRTLSALAKLFTCHLQRAGFTLGVKDILVTATADTERTRIIGELRVEEVGRKAISTALDLKLAGDTRNGEIVSELERQAGSNPHLRPIIDRCYKQELDGYTNAINKVCLPSGLLSKFPHNNLQLMVQSGAKGSTVNTMQISCLLGQIELEGKRPPVMISGRSLPSFPATEFSARAGGFIDGRFMTGIQPQEFFFHCMAGREGLIDTAVKTSRSGYLQRCLIKHLEGLTVGYDLTVRDSDKSVVQFLYGEDGMDISKVQFLNAKQMSFLADNSKAIIDKDTIKSLRKSSEESRKVEEHIKTVDTWQKNNANKIRANRISAFTLFSDHIKAKAPITNPDKVSNKTGRSRLTKFILSLWNDTDEETKERFVNECLSCPSPVNAVYQSDCHLGAINERLSSLMNSYKSEKSLAITKPKKHRKDFQNMLRLKAMQSMCAPGEPVGLLAAQSIGEPSTQMTLNTFHFAGRGEMNVTLGIPRLREILMMASRRIKTPSMEVPFREHVERTPHLATKAEKLRRVLTRVTVDQVLEKVDVWKWLEVTDSERQRQYTFKFQFLPHKLYKNDYNVKPKNILKYMENTFFKTMFTTIKKYAKLHSNLVSSGESKAPSKKKTDDDEDAVIDSGAPNATLADVSMFGGGGERGEGEEEEEQQGDSSDEEPEDGEDAKQGNRCQMKREGQEANDEEEEENREEDDRNLSEDEDNPKNTDELLSTTLNPDDDATPTEAKPSLDDSLKRSRDQILGTYSFAKNYRYDTERHLWCELTFALPVNYKNLDMTAILREAATRSVLWETPSVRRAITYKKDGRLMLRTDGINIVEMFKYNDILDLNNLYSNDIHGFAECYGIEAAGKVIVKEVTDVFKVYGITVDPRHLLLIADYMTFNGSFEPLSRKGMESSSSPLQQMSFEASLTFLKQATIRGKHDQLQNPSSCLMVGKPCNTGTGSFTLRQKLINI